MKQKGYEHPTKGQTEEANNKKSAISARPWPGLRGNPRIVRVSPLFGGKDRHSKVCTVKGLRDRRIRLSVPTAIQLYDLQNKLGLTQPSKVIDWLIEVTKLDIDKLPPLQISKDFDHFLIPHDPTAIPPPVFNDPKSSPFRKDLESNEVIYSERSSVAEKGKWINSDGFGNYGERIDDENCYHFEASQFGNHESVFSIPLMEANPASLFPASAVPQWLFCPPSTAPPPVVPLYHPYGGAHGDKNSSHFEQ